MWFRPGMNPAIPMNTKMTPKNMAKLRLFMSGSFRSDAWRQIGRCEKSGIRNMVHIRYVLNWRRFCDGPINDYSDSIRLFMTGGMACCGREEAHEGQARVNRGVRSCRKSQICFGEMKFHSRCIRGAEQGLGGLQIAQDGIGLLEVIEVCVDMIVQGTDHLEPFACGIPLLRWQPHLARIETFGPHLLGKGGLALRNHLTGLSDLCASRGKVDLVQLTRERLARLRLRVSGRSFRDFLLKRDDYRKGHSSREQSALDSHVLNHLRRKLAALDLFR